MENKKSFMCIVWFLYVSCGQKESASKRQHASFGGNLSETNADLRDYGGGTTGNWAAHTRHPSNTKLDICQETRPIQENRKQWNRNNLTAPSQRDRFMNNLLRFLLKYSGNLLAVILIKMILSGYNFAHVTTAQLSWHVQNCDLIGLPFSM